MQDAKNSLYFNSTEGLDRFFTSKAFFGEIFSTNLSISSIDAGEPSAISAYLNSNIVIVPELSTSIYLNFSIRLLNSYSFNYFTKIVITSFRNLLPPF